MSVRVNYGLKRSTRNNLKKLATYLEGLPRRYQHFGMSTYLSGYDDNGVTFEGEYAKCELGKSLKHFCGTTACAVGHGPDAGICMRGDELVPDTTWNGTVRYFTADWGTYAERFTEGKKSLWDWMFSGEWGKIDDHHYGAAARIRYVLAGRPIPNEPYVGYFWPTTAMKKLYREFRK